MKITFQQLKCLVKTAETGSMTNAAKALGVSQAALSEAVSQVEGEVGFKIFTRSRSGVSPTKKGVEALGYARRAVSGMESFEQRYGNKPAPKTRFAVSIHPMKIAVAAFNQTVNREKGKNYDFAIIPALFQEPIDDVASGAADLGVMLLTKSDEKRLMDLVKSNGLEFHELMEVPVCVFLDASHPLAKQTSVTRKDLAPYPCFGMEIKLLDRKTARQPLRPSEGQHLSPDSFDPDPATKRKIAEVAGYRTWCMLYPSHQPDNETVTLPIEPAEFSKIGYIIPAGAELDAVGNSFIKLLVKNGMAGVTFNAWSGRDLPLQPVGYALEETFPQEPACPPKAGA